MEIVWYGLQVTVVGMLVVFFGLILLIGCIKVMHAVLGKIQRKPDEPRPEGQAPAAPAATPVPPPAPVVYTPGPRLTSKDDALFAVLTAAIARVLADEGVNPEGGFRIRAVKPLNEAKPGPKLTQKDDAFYAVLTAAVSQVLADEGINPEGGFKITSVKALS